MAQKTPRYGHAPIPMHRVADEDAIEHTGDFAWDVDGERRHIVFAQPRPTEANPKGWLYCRIPVERGQNVRGQHWGWDGNEDAPTLTPSVHSIGHWHGWVRAGQLIEA